jgi:hypothetical protein
VELVEKREVSEFVEKFHQTSASRRGDERLPPPAQER